MTSTSLNATERHSLQTGIALVQKAVAHEKRGTQAVALSHYSRGLEHLLPLLHSSRCSDSLKTTLSHKCRQYLARARALREAIRSRCAVTDDDVVDDVTDGVRDEVGAAGDEIRVEEPLTRRDNYNEVERSGSGSNGDDSQGTNDGSSAESRNDIENENRSNGDDHIVKAHEKSDECVSNRANNASPLNPFVAKPDQINRSVKSTETRWHDGNMTDDQIPERLTTILDRVLAQTDSESSTQATCRWVEAQNIGLEELEMNLKEILLLPVLFPQLFTARMFTGRRRLLLYGHRGDGMLHLLQHFMRLCNTLTLLTASAHSLVATAMTGEASHNIWKALWSRACTDAPCAVCVTDMEVLRMDSAAGKEDNYPLDLIRKMTVELINHLNNFTKLKELVIFIGVTFRPWLLDSFLRRQFSVRRYCPPPSPEQRTAVLLSALQGVEHNLYHRDLQRIATLTSTFSRADMAVLAEEAQARLKQRVQEARFFRAVMGDGQTAENGHENGADTDRSNTCDETDNPGNAESSSSHKRHASSVQAANSFNSTTSDQAVYTPCDASDSDAVAMTWQEIRADRLLEPPLTLQDVLMALGDQQGHVTDTDRLRMTAWHEDFGQY